MTIFELERGAEDYSPEDNEVSHRNLTCLDELDVFLKRVGHPEVEQHMQAVTSVGNLVLKESVYSD